MDYPVTILKAARDACREELEAGRRGPWERRIKELDLVIMVADILPELTREELEDETD